MIRHYHKNRHRFSDPWGTSLKIFEKPIGRVKLIQEKLENKGHLASLTNASNNTKNLAPNYSLLPPTESGHNSEILSEDLTPQFLEKNYQSTKQQIGIIRNSTGILSDSLFKKTPRIKISNHDEESGDSEKKETSGFLNLLIKHMDTKQLWLHMTTFMGCPRAKWSNPPLWNENLSHWTMEILISVLLLVGDNKALARILILLVGISFGVKMSRNSSVLRTRSLALEENRGRRDKKISRQEGNKKKEGTKNTPWCYHTLCGLRNHSSKPKEARNSPNPTSSGSSRHCKELSQGGSLTVDPLEVRGQPDKLPRTAASPALVTLRDTSLVQDPEAVVIDRHAGLRQRPEMHRARPLSPTVMAPKPWPKDPATLATRQGIWTAKPIKLHELDVMLSYPCSTCSDIHITDTQYTTELLNPHLGTGPALLMSETSPREVFSQPSLNTTPSFAQPMSNTHPSHGSSEGRFGIAILGALRQKDTTESLTALRRATESQEALSLAMGALLGGQRQRTTPTVPLAMDSLSGGQRQRTTPTVPLAMDSLLGVTFAHAGDATGVTLDVFSLNTRSFPCRNLFHISKDGGNSDKVFKKALGHNGAPESDQRTTAGDATGVTPDDFSLNSCSSPCRNFSHRSKDGGNSGKIFKKIPLGT